MEIEMTLGKMNCSGTKLEFERKRIIHVDRVVWRMLGKLKAYSIFGQWCLTIKILEFERQRVICAIGVFWRSLRNLKAYSILGQCCLPMKILEFVRQSSNSCGWSCLKKFEETKILFDFWTKMSHSKTFRIWKQRVIRAVGVLWRRLREFKKQIWLWENAATLKKF